MTRRKFTYDAFVSYTRADFEWAQLVHDELVRKGFAVFLDRDRLVAGVEWSDQLLDALQESQHLVIVWSDHSRDSDWVLDEFSAFRADLRRSGAEADAPRHVIPIFLEGDYKPLRRYERIDVVKRAGAYPAGVAALAADVRRALIDKLAMSIREADTARPIPLLILTATRAELEAIDPDEPLPPPPLQGESLNSLIARLGFASRDQMLACYGDERGEWRPFGSPSSIREILDKLKDEINERLRSEGVVPFRWEPLDDFWAVPPGQVAERLKREAVVVVLDPLALYVPYVRTLTPNELVRTIRDNSQAVVMGLPPFALPAGAAALRRSIQGLATEIFESFYNPPVVSTAGVPRYVASIGDEADLKASLLTGIGAALAPGRTRGSVYTRT